MADQSISDPLQRSPRKGKNPVLVAHQPPNKILNFQQETGTAPQRQENNKEILGKRKLDSEGYMHDVIDVDLLDEFDTVEKAMDSGDDDNNDDDVDNDDDGCHFVENDIDDSNDITSRHQQNYTILNEEDIRQRLEEDITMICTVLSLSRVSASILLRHYNWSVSNVHDAWFADEEKVRMKVGLMEKPIVNSPNVKELACGICFENYCLPTMCAAACGHYFCTSCWTGYISTSIEDGPGCLTLRCPDLSCSAAVDQDMVNLLVSDEAKVKYRHYLLRSYIEDNRQIKWCPAPGCDYAVDYVVGSGSYNVSCKCTYSFCWNCVEEAHRPVDCDTVAKWMLKNTAESENVTWILAYSKPCPKCKRPIEKGVGCMHMTCTAPCRFEFCWLCLGSWSDHFKKTGGACNGYKDSKAGPQDEGEKRREMAKKSLERYTHYFERWAANNSSWQKAIKDLQQVQAVDLQEKLSIKHCQLESQLKFISEAWIQIIECRRVLKWSYAYGYYLPENEHAKRQFFEYLQGDAESCLERLHQCAEQDLQVHLNDAGPSSSFDDFRIKLAGLTSVTRNYFENLVRALENGLADVDTQTACSRMLSSKGSAEGSSKGLGGDNKTKGERRGAINFISAGAGHSQETPKGPWSCSHCTFTNDTSIITCQMCNQRWGSWSCLNCTYFNDRSATSCQMCTEGR